MRWVLKLNHFPNSPSLENACQTSRWSEASATTTTQPETGKKTPRTESPRMSSSKSKQILTSPKAHGMRRPRATSEKYVLGEIL